MTALPVLALLSCHGKEDDTAEARARWTSISGELEIDLEVDGRDVCDATISFTGTPYTGACPSCDFLFEVDATLERDEGSPACPYLPWLTLYAGGTDFWGEPTLLGFSSDYYGEAALMGGMTAYDDEMESYTGLYAFYVGDYGLSASLAGDLFTWSFIVDGKDGGLTGYQYGYYVLPCSVGEAHAYDAGPYGPGNTTYGSLSCEDHTVDVFEFQGQDGGTAYITVDATTKEAELDAVVWVYSPESCMAGFADESFPCSSGGRECPALALDTVAGRYVAVVSHFGCFGDAESGAYRFDLAASWDAKLVQIHDDLQNRGQGHFTLAGTATLAP